MGYRSSALFARLHKKDAYFSLRPVVHHLRNLCRSAKLTSYIHCSPHDSTDAQSDIYILPDRVLSRPLHASIRWSWSQSSREATMTLVRPVHASIQPSNQILSFFSAIAGRVEYVLVPTPQQAALTAGLRGQPPLMGLGLAFRKLREK